MTCQKIYAEIVPPRIVNAEVYKATAPGGEPYDGPYEVTPGDEAQTLQTAGKSLAQDVVVDRIPSNYGKISWDGATMTIS